MASEIVTEEQIRTAAYYIWLAEGQPMGEDAAHWHRARFLLETSAGDRGEPVGRTPRPAVRATAAAPAKTSARTVPARKAAGAGRARQEA